jgi:hypothetical protein
LHGIGDYLICFVIIAISGEITEHISDPRIRSTT